MNVNVCDAVSSPLDGSIKTKMLSFQLSTFQSILVTSIGSYFQNANLKTLSSKYCCFSLNDSKLNAVSSFQAASAKVHKRSADKINKIQLYISSLEKKNNSSFKLPFTVFVVILPEWTFIQIITVQINE